MEDNADEIRDERRSSFGCDEWQAVDGPHDAVEKSGDIRERREFLRALVGDYAAKSAAAQQTDPMAKEAMSSEIEKYGLPST